VQTWPTGPCAAWPPAAGAGAASLGIADSVTVLAATAAQADAAATVVANAVQAARGDRTRRHAACATTATWARARHGAGRRAAAGPGCRGFAPGAAKSGRIGAAGLVWFVLLCCQGQVAHSAWPLSRPWRAAAAAAAAPRLVQYLLNEMHRLPT
jgi:hypothetical protein